MPVVLMPSSSLPDARQAKEISSFMIMENMRLLFTAGRATKPFVL